MWSAAWSPVALVVGIGFGYVVDVGFRRCRRRGTTATNSYAAVQRSAAPSVSLSPPKKDDQQMVYRPAAPALPVLTSKQLKKLNLALGTPLKTKLLLRTGGKDARTLVDATEELYQTSGLTFDDFADVVNATVN